MENQDRELILGLANRLRQAVPVAKDSQAAVLIAQHIAPQPDALYLLVQAVLMQEEALRTAQARIAELETAASAAAHPPAPSYAPAPAPAPGGGFRSRMFGQGQGQSQGPTAGDAPQGRSGGGFLKTAAAAAAGVAGGALLFQGLNEVFGGHEAAAGEFHGGEGEPVGFDEAGGWDEGGQW
ncbi:DUF2076 domain-containing protein [Amycolatopsis sp. NPDC004747]